MRTTNYILAAIALSTSMVEAKSQNTKPTNYVLVNAGVIDTLIPDPSTNMASYDFNGGAIIYGALNTSSNHQIGGYVGVTFEGDLNVMVGGKVALGAQGYFNVNGTFSNSGTVTLLRANSSHVVGDFKNSGTINSGAALQIDGTFTQTKGSTTITGALTAQEVTILAGTVDFQSDVDDTSNTPQFYISAAGLLECDRSVTSTHDITFGKVGGTLALADPADFHGTIDNFRFGDTIDLVGHPEITSVAYINHGTSGVLELFDVTGLVASFNFNGKYTSGSFHISPDGHGGAKIS